MKVTIIKTPAEDNKFDKSSIEMSCPDVIGLSEALELYADFLRACGFNIKGELVVEEFSSDVLED